MLFAENSSLLRDYRALRRNERRDLLRKFEIFVVLLVLIRNQTVAAKQSNRTFYVFFGRIRNDVHEAQH